MIRLLLSRRWMVWHVLTLGAMVTCAWLAVWQWQRAGSAMGSALNIGYGLQWPVFAVFFGVMWWRFLRLEVRELRAAGFDGAPDGEPVRTTAGPEPVVAAGRPSTAAPGVPANAPAAGTGHGTGAAAVPGHGSTAGPGRADAPGAGTESAPGTPHADGTGHGDRAGSAAGQPPGDAPAEAARPSPFTSRPAGATAPRGTDPQLRAYNEELARLAVRHEESTP
ncbi:hypothetical protein [Pseudonocardia sp. HH130630-07]|uniref:hypothetical protein n=1 Tax=Pseudonocardia sp. HH130630-07 TaxID=1690815 RepID=UPI001E3E9586|nr:hypothetical protein [Pseudonocardia sp. HH130630-07]